MKKHPWILSIINVAFASRSVESIITYMLISTDPTIDNLQIRYFTQFNQFSAIIVQVCIIIRSINYTLSFFKEKFKGVRF